MHLWIVTIGSSDVQLISDKVNQAKGRTENQRSDKVWNCWYTDDLRADCYDISFEPKQILRDKEEAYRISPRILGRVYQASDESRQQEIWDYLTFPLLDNFVQALNNYPAPEAIAVFLTDQSTIFESDRQRSTLKSPYWQDTCELELILQTYFAEKFPGAPCKFIPLIPKSEAESLDNWNAVLDLVRGEFRNLTIADQPIQVNSGENVYVSHQAGTPAISSAVQFCSLAKFGDRVKFLVSNEYNPTFPEKPLEGSSYLRGIRIQEAKALLGEKSYNYAAVEALIGNYLKENEEINMLLNAARNWNVAKFNDFLDCLKLHPKFASEVTERTREENWWWKAYEEVYLALIRKDQGNIVEAFFHSFRAFEGIFAAWGQIYFKQHIESPKGIPYLSPSVLTDTEHPFSKVSGKKAKKAISDIKSKLESLSQKLQGEDVKIAKHERVEMNLRTLCNLFKSIRYADYDQNCPALKIFWDDDDDQNVSEKRNLIVHQVQGMADSDLWQFWGVSSQEDWKNRLLEFLNFIVKQDFPEGFASLEAASLMVKVHEELERAIASL